MGRQRPCADELGIFAGQTDQRWQSDYQFFQPDFEAILRGKLAQTELADLRLGWQATDIERHTAQVSINVQDRVTGSSQVVRGGYVVGCDGSRSVGLLSPQPRAADGTLLNDLVGYWFAGVGSQVTVDAVDDAVRQAWRELGAVTVPDFGATTLWLADALADAAFIRPDRYVFAATHGPEHHAQAKPLLRTQTTQKETV